MLHYCNVIMLPSCYDNVTMSLHYSTVTHMEFRVVSGISTVLSYIG